MPSSACISGPGGGGGGGVGCCGGSGGGGSDAQPGADGASIFPGLIPLLYAYLDLIDVDPATRALLNTYIRFVAARASGEAMTGASWQRAFVRRHPDYKGDGVVGPGVAYDLLTAINGIAAGVVPAPELVGRHAPPPIWYPTVPTAAELGASGAPEGGAAGGRMRGASFAQDVRAASTRCATIQALLQKYARSRQKHHEGDALPPPLPPTPVVD